MGIYSLSRYGIVQIHEDFGQASLPVLGPILFYIILSLLVLIMESNWYTFFLNRINFIMPIFVIWNAIYCLVESFDTIYSFYMTELMSYEIDTIMGDLYVLFKLWFNYFR
jgi:hypothetical protein